MNLPNLLGSHPLTVRALSTSTNTRRPSIFFPSACLYAAIINIIGGKQLDWTKTLYKNFDVLKKIEYPSQFKWKCLTSYWNSWIKFVDWRVDKIAQIVSLKCIETNLKYIGTKTYQPHKNKNVNLVEKIRK